MNTLTKILFAIMLLIGISNGLYIGRGNKVQNQDENLNKFMQNQGLINQKVNSLNNQNDHQENVNTDPQDETPDHFMQVYRNIIQQMRVSKGTLKTSLNVELADKSQKVLKRHRRKIAVRMISDMPSDQIDELLKIFNDKHEIDDTYDDNMNGSEDDDDDDYSDPQKNLPSAKDPDYMYENLYEDEEDLAVPAKSRHNSQYGSFQDLILQANRHQRQRETYEMRLGTQVNHHFM